ncbi:MAG TPA: hypothetical protein VMI31_04230, partial [Fimbriimonadaceae bacterium]|nr:hypothetical protein [Fimbriimonadaceae bacterium]
MRDEFAGISGFLIQSGRDQLPIVVDAIARNMPVDGVVAFKYVTGAIPKRPRMPLVTHFGALFESGDLVFMIFFLRREKPVWNA